MGREGDGDSGCATRRRRCFFSFFLSLVAGWCWDICVFLFWFLEDALSCKEYGPVDWTAAGRERGGICCAAVLWMGVLTWAERQTPGEAIILYGTVYTYLLFASAQSASCWVTVVVFMWWCGGVVFVVL